MFLNNRFYNVVLMVSILTFQCCHTTKVCKSTSACVDTTAVSQNADTVPGLGILELPKYIPVTEWRGKTFKILERQSFLKQFGYEIFTCKEFSGCKEIADTAIALSNHRMRADRFEKKVLTVEEVVPSGSEYLITFREPIKNVKVYANTHNGVIKDLAPDSDFEQARARWLNKVVYARNRVITTSIKDGGAFGSQKVAITEPLTVIDVTWGTSPMPVKPLWLWVVTSGGSKGFIPVSYSWTNAPYRTSQNAWDTDILEENPKSVFKWDPVYWDAIENHSILLGMSREQVRLTWGDPLSITEERYEGVVCECYKYSAQKLIFNQTELVAVLDLFK